MRQVQKLSNIWLRPLIILGGLFFMAALGFKASPNQLMLVPFLPVGVALGLAVLRWPVLGLIGAAVAGMIVPYVGPSGLNATMIVLAMSLGLWILDIFIRRNQVPIAPSRPLMPLFAFLVVSVISFGVGQFPWLTFAVHAPLGAQLGGLAVVVLSAVTFLLAANQVRDLRWLNAMVWVILAFAIMSMLGRSILPLFGLPTGRIFQHVGTVFYIWLVALAFSQAAFNDELHPGWRMILGGVVLVTLYVLFVMKFDDKSGWLSAFACIGAMLGARSWRFGLAMIPVGLLAVILLWSRIVGTDEYSVSTRLDAWIIMAQIVKISPILGLGFANYYWYTPLFPIRGYAVSFNSHNNYVDIVAQTGLVGLVCFLWLLFEIGLLAWRLRDMVPSGFARAYVYGALGGLAGMAVAGMLGDWVLPFFYNIGLNGFRSSMIGWLFLGGLLSVEQMFAASKSKREAVPLPAERFHKRVTQRPSL